ncbi:MAG: hypothetical protein AAB397_01370 [Patescibacteria group bacterium]
MIKKISKSITIIEITHIENSPIVLLKLIAFGKQYVSRFDIMKDMFIDHNLNHLITIVEREKITNYIKNIEE